MILKIFTLSLISFALSVEARSEDIKKYYDTGEEIQICRSPDEISHPLGVKGQPYFLKYKDRERLSTYLTIVIWESDISNLEINPFNYFTSENRCITGNVTKYKGENQLVVKNYRQLLLKGKK